MDVASATHMCAENETRWSVVIFAQADLPPGHVGCSLLETCHERGPLVPSVPGAPIQQPLGLEPASRA